MTKRKITETIAQLLPRFASREALALSLESENRDLLAQLHRQVHSRGDAGIGKRIERNQQLLKGLSC